MSNWRQIQGRIRRAKTSPDAAAKLGELFQKTRDAMVAFEVGVCEEKAGRNEEAVHWYTLAAQRFRRPEWRQKAADALARLGAPVPEFIPEAPRAAPAEFAASSEGAQENSDGFETAGEVDGESHSAAPPAEVSASPDAPSSAVAPRDDVRRRRRGRRGGRRHRRGGAATPGVGATPQTAARPANSESATLRVPEPAAEISSTSAVVLEPVFSAPESEATLRVTDRATNVRSGEPALASRFAHLESLLRRLISGQLHRVDEVDNAPAGPGVFLLSDADLTTNYYVEACQTLRVGAGQLARAGRAGRGAREHGGGSLRSQLAEHLGISDAKVSDYLKKHCVVRWLQLDVDAPHLAHFAIAVLRPTLNVE